MKPTRDNGRQLGELIQYFAIAAVSLSFAGSLAFYVAHSVAHAFASTAALFPH